MSDAPQAMARLGRWHLLLLLPLLYYLIWILVHPEFQWGDGLELTAVAADLGVAHPTGYPLYTLIGHLFLYLPVGGPYTLMLLFSAITTWLMVIGFYFFCREFTGLVFEGETVDRVSILAAVLIGFSSIGLSLATTVEVYALNAALVVWIIYFCWKAMDREEGKYLIVAGGLLGLAASHHLSSLAIGALFIGAAYTLFWKKDYKSIAISCALGLVIPVLAYSSLGLRVPAEESQGIAWGAPFNAAGIIEHLRGGEYRQFQFLMENASTPFTLETWLPFAGFRTMSVVDALGAVVAGEGPTALLFGLLILILGIAGVFFSARVFEGKLPFVAGLIAALALQLVFIYTYQIPDIYDYFHLLNIVLLLFSFVGLLGLLGHAFQDDYKQTQSAYIGLGLCLLITVLNGAIPKFLYPHKLAVAWQERLFQQLPEGAGLLTGGDADTYTMWYSQIAAGERTDVFTFGANFYRFPWYRQTLNVGDPRRDAVSFRSGPPATSLMGYVEELDSHVIEPMLTHGPLYTTLADQAALRVLSEKYLIVPVDPLLSDQEFEALILSGEINIAPPMLYEIRKRQR